MQAILCSLFGSNKYLADCRLLQLLTFYFRPLSLPAIRTIKSFLFASPLWMFWSTAWLEKHRNVFVPINRLFATFVFALAYYFISSHTSFSPNELLLFFPFECYHVGGCDSVPLTQLPPHSCPLCLFYPFCASFFRPPSRWKSVGFLFYKLRTRFASLLKIVRPSERPTVPFLHCGHPTTNGKSSKWECVGGRTKSFFQPIGLFQLLCAERHEHMENQQH